MEDKARLPMQVPYGAVYFRKSNPPRKDWERDYAQAARDGMNIFRHWFMWGCIERAPGRFDWDDYDAQLDLAARHGIKTIIAEITTSVPEWLAFERPDLLCVDRDGRRAVTQMGVSSATGGFNAGLCLDKPEARELTGRFLQALAERYKEHPATLGYDVWNECNYPHNLCWCEDTAAQFRLWLQRKYGSLERLEDAWHRYSYCDWAQVRPPASLYFYPDSIDWLEFRKENAYGAMQWRIDTLRAVDGKSLICAHGTGQSIDNMALGGSDEWEAASHVQVYGFTWVACRRGSEPWKQWHAVDITRAGARGRTFWHAEAQGGPLWLQPQVVGRPREDGRIPQAEDLRLWNLVSLAGGARGILYPRWRPLLNGPLFGAFGPYGMDGLPTPRSEMASSIAKWANDPARKELFEAAPVPGDVGIVVVPAAQTASRLLSMFGSEDNYKAMMWGAYRGFFDANIQADWVHIDDIDRCGALYLPYPLMLRSEDARRIRSWVEKGGRLVSEGCPGYFGDGGAAGAVQPNLGLDEVFGVREAGIEFTPDLLPGTTFRASIGPGAQVEVGCAEYLQTYRPTSARACGSLDAAADVTAAVAAAENSFGKGRTLLLGTCPSQAYYRRPTAEGGRLFTALLEWLGVERAVTVDNPDIKARLASSAGGLFLWLVNMSAGPREADIAVARRFDAEGIERVHRGEPSAARWANGRIRARVPARDAVVVRIARPRSAS